MELDKRIAEYADLIMSDVNTLLADGNNLTERQQHFVSEIFKWLEHLISRNNFYVSYPLPLTEIAYRNQKTKMVHDLRTSVAMIIGLCKVIDQFDGLFMWSEKEILTLNHMREYIILIQAILKSFSKEWNDRIEW